MKITIPRPPSVNHLYGRNGWRTYIKDEGEAWFEEASYLIKSQMGRYESITKPCSLKIWIFYCGRFDIDNGLKATLDLLAKRMGIIKDDHLIVKLEVLKIKVDHRQEQKMELEIIEKPL